MAARTIGRYVVREEIGQGGMATVYRAFDPQFQRDVAIKVLPLHFLHDPRFRARFEREARIVAGLQHPAIVPVYDFGEDTSQPYLVMALMSGGSLEDRLRQGPMPLAETERILGRLAPALDAAHQKGIIHRDLKPANILFDQWNEPYITDFGIVKLTGGSGDDSASLTTVGGIIGTPAYMSPEQVQGGEIDGRSDIYSLGVILFQMLSGRLPYDATTPIGLAFKHVSDPIPSIRAMSGVRLPAEYQPVINKAMAKQPAERYPTAVALARDLTRLVHGSAPQPTIVLPKDAPLAATQRVADTPAALAAAGLAGAKMAASPTARVEPPPSAVPSPAPLTAPAVAPASTPRAARRGPPIWLFGLLGLLLLGGGAAAFLLLRGGGDEPEATSVAVVAPDWTATATGPATATATATATAAATGESAVAAGETPGAPVSPTAAATPRPLKTAVTPPAVPAVIRVTAPTVDARGGPGETFPVVVQLPQGTELRVIGRTEDSAWFNVMLDETTPAWVPAAAVEALSPAAMAGVPVAATILPSPTATATLTPTATRRLPTPTRPLPTATRPAPTQAPIATEPPPPTSEPEQPTEEPPTPVPVEDTPTPVP